MRSLTQALQDHELIVLRVIGEWWELDLTGADKAASATALAERLAQLDMAQELQFLPPEEAAALKALAAANGRIPVAAYEREHGAVRLMGPGRLEREEPWFDPQSPAEALWYRGFLYRGFDETAEGVIEFYYLPHEFMAQFPQTTSATVPQTAPSALAPVDPPAEWETAVTDAADDLTTLLSLAQTTALRPAALDKLHQLLLNPDTDRRSLLLTLAREMGMLKQSETGIRPTRTAVNWLQQSREQQLRALADAWSQSNWNDLCHTPGLHCEGDHWQNDPILARTALLDALPRTPHWYAIADLTALIKETDPDFQRPDGNYDTWYIRDEAGGEYVRGFEHWDLVEGRLIPYLLQGPLFWLGLTETAVLDNQSFYRLTDRALAWLANEPASTQETRVPLRVEPDAVIIAPHNADRYARFQAARISEAEPVTRGRPYRYRLTPHSLAQAQKEGIAPQRIIQFLTEAGERPLPASVKRGIERWGEKGVEAKLETAVILRVRDEEILETLRTNPKTRDYIDQTLGPLAATVRPENWQKLRTAAAQLGLLLETE
ncbi:MAG: hypothetical protein HF973_18995, partial [Chloroflexi bacterium]|nr:hypothetical protein [Chloroflexota bacterium]